MRGIRNPVVACLVCGREMTSNLIGRHGVIHEPDHDEALRRRKAARQRIYAKTEAGLATIERTKRSPKCIATRARHSNAWKLTPRGRIAAKAHSRVKFALRTGRLIKGTCHCGSTQAVAHHPRGYEGRAALDVEWLCPLHHVEAHGRAAS